MPWQKHPPTTHCVRFIIQNSELALHVVVNIKTSGKNEAKNAECIQLLTKPGENACSNVNMYAIYYICMYVRMSKFYMNIYSVGQQGNRLGWHQQTTDT